MQSNEGIWMSADIPEARKEHEVPGKGALAGIGSQGQLQGRGYHWVQPASWRT